MAVRTRAGGRSDVERRVDVDGAAVGGAPGVNQSSEAQQSQVPRAGSGRERGRQELQPTD